MIRFPTFRSSPDHAKTAKESLSDILCKYHGRSNSTSTSTSDTKSSLTPTTSRPRHSDPGPGTSRHRQRQRKMVSSKGEPTDPKLREEVKEEVKAEEKGGGKGSWSAWKSGEMARRYEERGGDYKDTGDNKNKAQKGPPEKKK